MSPKEYEPMMEQIARLERELEEARTQRDSAEQEWSKWRKRALSAELEASDSGRVPLLTQRIARLERELEEAKRRWSRSMDDHDTVLKLLEAERAKVEFYRRDDAALRTSLEEARQAEKEAHERADYWTEEAVKLNAQAEEARQERDDLTHDIGTRNARIGELEAALNDIIFEADPEEAVAIARRALQSTTDHEELPEPIRPDPVEPSQ